MIHKICAALLALVLLAGVCLAADKPVSDDAIYDQVRIKLAGDRRREGRRPERWMCKEGVVTLSGTVETDRQKDRRPPSWRRR